MNEFNLEDTGSTDATVGSTERKDWLEVAKAAFHESTDYMEASLRRQRERNYAAFKSKHAPGSKYFSDAYKFRSKFYRPKIRGAIRRHEAAAAIAYFSTQDVVSVTAENPADENKRLSALLQHELLNYRLETSIPWFQTLIGAYQEAMVVGAVCSKQYWEYEDKEVTVDVPAMDEMGNQLLNENSEPLFKSETTTEVVKDRPVVKLIPPENVRYSPSADWTDPVESSPYFIHMMPMFVEDIKSRMKSEDTKTGQPAWLDLTDAQIFSADSTEYDSTRQSREGTNRQDSQENNSDVSEFNTRWVHENHIRYKGEDMVFYTLGTQFLLSDPVPLSEVYLQGKRPFVVGVSQIEAHRLEPTSVAELGASANAEVNDIANQRMDNVKLAMNKRYFIKRTANVDTRALARSVPGGSILVDNPDTDVRIHETGDVTGSSFQEQDRVSLDFDEVVGAFSPSSVQSNRNMNETVGGMELLSNDSNSLSEYQLRVFTETWTERVLRQVAALERAYETDEIVIKIAGDRAGIWSQMKSIPFSMLEDEHPVRIAVGFGATSPTRRIEKLALGLNTVAQFSPMAVQQLDSEALISEVFGALGFKSGDRFFKTTGEDGEEQDPQVAQLTQQVQELQAALQSGQADAEAKMQIADMNNQAKMQMEQMKIQASAQADQLKQQSTIQVAQMKQQLDYIDKQIAAEKNKIAAGELELQKQALIYQMKLKEVELLKADKDSMAGLLMRDNYGLAPQAEG